MSDLNLQKQVAEAIKEFAKQQETFIKLSNPDWKPTVWVSAFSTIQCKICGTTTKNDKEWDFSWWLCPKCDCNRNVGDHGELTEGKYV